MVNETREGTGFVDRLKRFIPGRKPQAPAVVPTTQPQEVPVTVAQKEQSPRVLSPFEQIQQLLERESETTDPNKVIGSRSVKLEKKVYNATPGRTKDPVYITITQIATNREWDNRLSVSIYIETDADAKKYNREHHLRGLPEGKNLQGSLVISQQEPQLTLNPVNSRYISEPDDIWEILGLSKPKYDGDTSIWSGLPKTRYAQRTSPCTTNDAEALRKVVRFITVDETDRSTPKVISRR